VGDYISYYTVLSIHDKMDFHQLDNAHAKRITKKTSSAFRNFGCRGGFIYQYL